MLLSSIPCLKSQIDIQTQERLNRSWRKGRGNAFIRTVDESPFPTIVSCWPVLTFSTSFHPVNYPAGFIKASYFRHGSTSSGSILLSSSFPRPPPPLPLLHFDGLTRSRPKRESIKADDSLLACQIHFDSMNIDQFFCFKVSITFETMMDRTILISFGVEYGNFIPVSLRDLKIPQLLQ